MLVLGTSSYSFGDFFMDGAMIEVENIRKEFRVPIRIEDNIINRFKSLFIRRYEIKCAVDDISFFIGRGDIVGYVGPNGAGKSTTIKMLAGILTPTEGRIVANGIIPYKKRIDNAKSIGVVFGQRSQLYWDLPMNDSFLLHKRMYEIDDKVFRENVNWFVKVLQMERFINLPIRQLSLGQKMRANIAISLLHNPKIVYLDEPTIGLDIVAKNNIREFILEINRRLNTTFIITTHDMDDIEQICNRLIILNHGKIYYDGLLQKFKDEFGDIFRIDIKLGSPSVVEHPHMEITMIDESSCQVLCNKKNILIAEAITYLIKNYHVKDIKVYESDVESILRDLYKRN
jgi:ABC-2 type transport system ATP-binding protein